MIDPGDSETDVDTLMQRVRAQAVHGTYVYGSELDTTPVEALLQTAQQLAQVRTHWPRRFRMFPFGISAGLRRLALRFLAFAFNDQRNVNFALIAAIREMMQMNRELHSVIASLQAEVRQLEERLTRAEHGVE